MLSAIGLALDLVGAIALTLGLYRHSRGIYPGLARGPEDFAQDTGFGAVGAAFLVAGFAMQGLQYFGWTVETCRAATAAAAGLTILLGALVGWLAYGLIWLTAYGREQRWVENNFPSLALRHGRRAPAGRWGWRFWHQEYD